MPSEWWIALSRIQFHDVVDILLMAFIAYNLLLLVKGTRGWYIAAGILSLVVFYYLARLLNLRTLEWLLTRFGPYIVFALIVIFQSEIRRALAELGRGNPFGRLRRRRQRRGSYEEVALAAAAMADRKIGALIVIERTFGLKNYMESGIEVDSAVSSGLLVSIFTPGTPLHDGAVIIQGDRVLAAACFLPLALDPSLSTDLGTRHRAALGITQETDSIAIVVSEETGIISVVSKGDMIRNLNGSSLLAFLCKEDNQAQNGGVSAGRWTESLTELPRSLFFRNPLLKGLALLLGALVWFQVAGEETVQRIVPAPIVFTNMPQGLEIVGEAPTEVPIVVRTERTDAPVDPSRFAVVLDLRSAQPGDQVFPLTQQNVAQLPSGVEVVKVLSSELRLRLEKTLTKSVRVMARLEGRLADGAILEGVTVSPDSATVIGPERRVRQISTVNTEPVALNGADTTFTRTIQLEAPDARVRFDGRQQVTVTVSITPAPARAKPKR